MEKFESEFGYIQPLGEIDAVSTTILEILPGRTIESHMHHKTKEIEIVIEGEIEVDGEKKTAEEVMIWERGVPHAYSNNSNKPAKVLCIAMPKYDPYDSFSV